MMKYFFTKHKRIVNENSEKIHLDEPLNPLTIEFIEWQSSGGTIEESEIELPEEIEAQFNEQIEEFLKKKKVDGSYFFDCMEAKVTKALFSMERTALMTLLGEMQTHLYPTLNLIRGGDFASALVIFQTATAPENEMILPFWNEARSFCVRYYLENYPR